MNKHPSFIIKQILKDHWFNFVKSNSKFTIRPIVFKEVNKVIYCGDFSQGHALYQCSHCGSILHVPFRCKSHFCNTCGMQYVNSRAFNLSKKLIKCKHRHLVFTIPSELRSFFRKDRSLLNILFQATLLDLLEKSIGPSFYQLKTSLYYSYKDGFYVYAKPNPLADTNKAIQYVVRYIGRPAMAQSRILNYDGQTVTFWYQRHEDNKKVILSFIFQKVSLKLSATMVFMQRNINLAIFFLRCCLKINVSFMNAILIGMNVSYCPSAMILLNVVVVTSWN